MALLLLTGTAAFGGGRFVDVSARCPRYFETADGKTWIPIGINLCYAHPDESTAYDCPEPETLAKMERWMRAFAANGGNYIRLFLCRPTFEVLTDRVGEYNAHNGENLVKIVKLAEELGIRIKFTLEVFRSVKPAAEVTDEWGIKCNKPLYAPFAGGTMHGFYTSEKCHDIFMGKVRYLASLGLGDSPAVICIEPFNEIDSTGAPEDWTPWSARVLREFEDIFPKQMVTQNMGSFGSPHAFRVYDILGRTEPNAFLQVHRYLDPGAPERWARSLAEGTGLEVEIGRISAPVTTDADAPVVQDLARHLRARWPNRPVPFVRMNGATDARSFVKLGVPLVISSVEKRGDHADSEGVRLASLDEVGDAFRDFFLGAGVPA